MAKEHDPPDRREFLRSLRFWERLPRRNRVAAEGKVEPTSGAQPQRRRGPWQFSLRSLLIVTFYVAVTLATTGKAIIEKPGALVRFMLDVFIFWLIANACIDLFDRLLWKLAGQKRERK